jgi:LPXTG-motif cell wall-anchored protein
MAVASAAGGLLLAPAVLPAADGEPAGQEPLVAAIEADANPVSAGTEVRLDASRTTGVAGAGVRHSWDLDGDGSFEADTGDDPETTVTPEQPGTVNVKVRVLDGEGRTADADLDLVVEEGKAINEGEAGEEPADPEAGAAPEPAEEPAREPEAAEPDAEPEPDAAPQPDRAEPQADPVPQPDAEPAPVPTAKRLLAAPKLTRARSTTKLDLRLAASRGVTIQNFAFSPASISVSVGDTVTWTNRDDAPHNAVGTGVKTPTLDKGQSGSATFSKAGSFSYICTIHPSMKGTVEVAAAGASGSGSGDSGDDTGAAGTTDDPAATSGGLPQTGRDLIAVVLVGLLLFTAGGLLRRLTPQRHT